MEELHIAGAGGIGCAVGYALCAAGLRVTFVEANPEKVRWGQAHGVAVDAWPSLPARFQTFDEWNPPPDATLLLCTKCYDNAAVLARLPPQVSPIPIQNGFDHALLDRGGSLEGIA